MTTIALRRRIRGFVEDKRRLIGFLGTGHGEARHVDNFAACRLMLGQHYATDIDAELMGRTIGEDFALKRLDQLAPDCVSFLAVNIARKKSKLVTTIKTRQDVIWSERSSETFHDNSQNLVADGAAVNIIDPFEFVDIQ